MNADKATRAVDEAFGALRTGIEPAVAAPPSVERIAGRARRRRAVRVGLAGVAVLAVLAGGYAATGSRVAGPPPDLPPGASATPPKVDGDRTQAAKIPAGFLPREREAQGAIDDFDYNRDCFGEPVMRRSAQRFVGAQADQTVITENLYVYAEENTARSVMTGLRQRLRACSGFPDAAVLQPQASPAWGDEAATITLAKPADGAGEHTGARVRYDVVRAGPAIFEIMGYPEIAQIDQDAQGVAGRLCYYDAVCVPAVGRPVALPKLTNGGEAWAAVLAVFRPGEPEGLPGESIAAAAELGYRAALVPGGCDDGAAVPLGLTDSGSRYTVVYFASRADAQALLDALPHLPGTVVKVRTYCL
ncbi:hypothetical protein KZZ52_13570 [Dactylosporangium sp. AC04546]|uniref:hypothetical protein n=1 Tax=Dactylosporangium sp. AC04546 TaxID=2862460 RepID=UPI001EDDCDED|nr:hypothetical protein [Dactylosporangium sp. AC04546]WVK86356.1 hypothetical protein KZZ52_13570 [Dactylosporangium sp. AC04546]